MVESTNKKNLHADTSGTPLPVKTPINFKQRQELSKKDNSAALKKLLTVSFVSVFFIIA
jgi:hypothetical protein